MQTSFYNLLSFGYVKVSLRLHWSLFCQVDSGWAVTTDGIFDPSSSQLWGSLIYIAIIKMLSAGQKSLWTAKKKGAGAKGEFMKMHLAVYPYEVQFLNKVDYPTAFYFQKNYQIIGQVNAPVPPAPKGAKIQLEDIKNIIYFRLYSPDNMVYKWSVYKQDQDQEECLDSCTLNPSFAVNTFIAPQQATNSLTSMIRPKPIDREMRLKFPKIGVILTFQLIIAEDPAFIRQFVQRKMINKQDEQNYLKAEHPVDNILISSRRGKTPSASFLHKSSDPLVEPTLPFNSQNTTEPLSKERREEPAPLVKAGTLQNLIFNFESSDNVQTNSGGPGQLNIQSLEIREQTDPDLQFGAEQTHHKPATKPNTSQETFREQFKERDLGVLKLESDQGGRFRQDPVDRKLEMLELQAIEQEKLSRECTVNISPFEVELTPKVNKSSKYKGKAPLSLAQIEQIQAQIPPQNSGFKKAITIFVISIVLFILAATLSGGMRRKTQKRKTKR